MQEATSLGPQGPEKLQTANRDLRFLAVQSWASHCTPLSLFGSITPTHKVAEGAGKVCNLYAQAWPSRVPFLALLSAGSRGSAQPGLGIGWCPCFHGSNGLAASSLLTL